MGIIDDAGLLVNGYVNLDLFYIYISDVKKKLRTGRGILGVPPTLDDHMDPVPPYQVVDIENWKTYTEFHKIWGDRYSRMLTMINLPSQFLLAQKTGLVDPSALAKKLGSKKSPDAKLPDTLYEMQGQNPPGVVGAPPPKIDEVMAELMSGPPQKKTLDYINKYLSDIDIFDSQTITAFIGALTEPEKNAVGKFARPELFPLGYIDWRNYDNHFFENALDVHKSMMGTAAGLFPAAISEMSSGAGCNTLITAVYAAAKSKPYKSMETSKLEIAATEILVQHQTLIHCAVLFGMNIGGGGLLKGLLATPAPQGFGLLDPSRSYEIVIDTERQSKSQSNEPVTQENAASGDVGGQNTTTNKNQTDVAATQSTSGEQPEKSAEQVNQYDQSPNKTRVDESGEFVYNPEDNNPDEYKGDAATKTTKFGSTVSIVKEDTTPADIGPRQDYATVPLPPAEDPKKDDNEDEDGQKDKKTGIDTRLGSIRQRAKDIFEGGGTVRQGGILGPIPVDLPLGDPGWKATLKGWKGSDANTDPTWNQQIAGCTGAPGSGWDTAGMRRNIEAAKSMNEADAQAKMDTAQLIPTSCGQLAGWILANMCLDSEHPPSQVNLMFKPDAEMEQKVKEQGFPFVARDFPEFHNGVAVGSPALGGLGYMAAAVGAWVNINGRGRNNLGFNIPPVDIYKIRRPKYGDIYLHRDGADLIRHAGIILYWEQGDDWVITADAGVSSVNTNWRNGMRGTEEIIANSYEGMVYAKRKLTPRPYDGWITDKVDDSSHGHSKDERIIFGYIDMELFIAGLIKKFGDKYPKPSWVKF